MEFAGVVGAKGVALISEAYRRLNREAHEDPTYGISGHRHAELVQSVIDRAKAKTLLDYGCGKQTLRPLVDVEYHAYDPAIPGLDGEPEPADVVFCGDVMEHVELEYTDAVLAHVMALARCAAVFVICCEPGNRILGDGLPAHRNVRPPKAWREKLSALGRLEEAPSISRKAEVRFIVWKA